MTPRLPSFLSRIRLSPKQRLFLLLDDPEAFYGGAARGGKSWALVLAAAQYLDVPGYAALLLRRTHPELIRADGLIPIAHQMFSSVACAEWSQTTSTYTFHLAGGVSKLEFGFMQYEHERFKYQGSAYQFTGYDEVTHFTKLQYTYLFTRHTRPSDPSNPLSRVPIRMRATSNPPDEDSAGWSWVKKRFITEREKNDIVFVPAGLGDNPFVDQEQYRKSLGKMDKVNRARLGDGDWDILAAGNMFRREWFSEPIGYRPRGLRLVRFWDLAHTKMKPGKEPDFTVGLLYGVDSEGQYFILDIVRLRDTSHAIENIVRATAREDGPAVKIRMEQEPAGGISLIEHYGRKVLPGYDFKGIPAGSSDPSIRWGPISSAAERGLVRLFSGRWQEALFDEIESAPHGSHDDQLTAWAGAHAELALGYPDPEIL